MRPRLEKIEQRRRKHEQRTESRTGEELGINCYDREILRMASDDSGINEALFGQTDEKLKKSPLFRIARKNPYKGGVIPPESAD